MRVFGRGTSMMFSILRRVTGVEVIEDLSEFFQAFSGMLGGFRERAKRVNELLANPETCFLVVCGPQGEPVTEAVYFHRKLVEAKLPFGGVIVNKVHYESELPDYGEGFAAELAEALGDEDLARSGADELRRLPGVGGPRPAQHQAADGGDARPRGDPGPPPGQRRARPLRADARSTATCSPPAPRSEPRSRPADGALTTEPPGPGPSETLFLGDRRRKLGGLKLVVRLGAPAAVVAQLAHVPLGRLGRGKR